MQIIFFSPQSSCGCSVRSARSHPKSYWLFERWGHGRGITTHINYIKSTLYHHGQINYHPSSYCCSAPSPQKNICSRLGQCTFRCKRIYKAHPNTDPKIFRVTSNRENSHSTNKQIQNPNPQHNTTLYYIYINYKII